jgi:hypothetical protein
MNGLLDPGPNYDDCVEDKSENQSSDPVAAVSEEPNADVRRTFEASADPAAQASTRFTRSSAAGGAPATVAWEIGGAILVASLGFAANLFGAVNVSRPWLAAGLAVLAIAGLFAVRAVQYWSDPVRSRAALAGVTLSLLVFIGGVGIYHQVTEGVSTARNYEYVLNGATEVQCLSVSGEPGGAPLLLAPGANVALAPVCGAATIEIACRSVAGDEGWLRPAGTTYWLPESALRPQSGESVMELPGC